MRIPSDIDRADPLVFGLSARQLSILAIAAMASWILIEGLRTLVPLPVAAAITTPFSVLGLGLALMRRDGLSGDRFALAVLRHLHSPRRLVQMTDDAVPIRSLRSFDGRRLAALQLPLREIRDDGVLDLGPDGAAAIARVVPINFNLRSAEEQALLAAGFGRFLNSLQQPVQIVLRSERADLGAAVTAIRTAAPGLPHPALEQAALAHAAFLDELSLTHRILRREVLLVARAVASSAASTVGAHVAEMCGALSQAGLTAGRLDGRNVGAALERATGAVAKARDEMCAPGEVVRGRPPVEACS